jgi:predicted transposase/invertase (TIGR01784 family)
MDYLKNERINPETTAPGLQEARERLDLLMMSDEERRSYEHYIDTLVRDTDVLQTQLLEARIEGERARAKAIASRMRQRGVPDSEIAELTGLTIEEVRDLTE